MQLIRNLKIGPKLGGSFAVSLGLMTFIAVIVYVGIQSLLESSRWVNHTHEVISTAQDVGLDMVDMETGQRGFLIAGKEEYLEPYFNGIKKIVSDLKKGRDLTSDNPAQVERWDEVLRLKKRWISEAAEPEIELRKNITLGADVIAEFKRLSSRTVGKNIFDSIRKALAALESGFIDDPEALHLVTKVTLALVNMETGQRGFLLSGKEESLEPYVNGAKDLTNNLALLTDRLVDSQVSKSDLNKVQTLVNKWRKDAADLEINARREMNKYSKNIDDVAAALKDGSGKVLMDSIRLKLKEITDEEKILIVQRIESQKSTETFVTSTSFFGTLIALIIGSSAAFLITKGIKVRINETQEALSLISDGDLTARVPITSTDEIGELGQSFNSFTHKLQIILREISDAANELSFASKTMNDITEKSTIAILSQQQETEMVSASMSQMTSTSLEVATNAELASSAAQQADEESKIGNSIVDETISSINSLAKDIDTSAQIIIKLKQDSENIGAVLSVIKGVAEQTNLLALNAAIEAARAGEQGRGFAVVADEVRSLAQRTQESTLEIENSIETLQSASHEAVESMESSRENVEATVLKAQAAGESLSNITSSVETISQMNTQIATAAEEQTMVSNEISRNVTNIQEVTDQTASNTKETAVSSGEVMDLSNRLANLVNQFKINE